MNRNSMLRQLIFLGLVCSMVLLMGVRWGQAAEPLTLGKALTLALDSNLDVLSAREELTRADGYYTSIRSGLLPALSIEGTHTQQEETNGKPDRETVGELKLSQNIYSGGVVRAGERQARVLRRQVEEKLQSVEETVAWEVYESFLAVLQAQADLDTAQAAFSYAQNDVKNLTKRRELGLATGLEVTRAEQQLESDRAGLIRAKNNLDVARIDLFTLLRLEPEAPGEVTGDLEEVPFPGDRNSSLDAALANRPDLKDLISQKESQSENITIVEGNLKPSVSLSAGWSYTDDSSDDEDDSDEWFASLNVEIPLYDGGLTKGKVRQERAILTQAEQAIIRKEETIRAEVAKAWLDIESAAETVGASEKKLELAKETLRLAEVGYREGVNVQLDVLDARTTLTEARQSLASAKKTHRLAVAWLWKAEGRLVPQALNGSRENAED